MRPILTILLVNLLLFCSFVPHVAAMDLTVERQVQTALKQSRALLLKIELKQRSGTSVSEDITRLKELAASLKEYHQQLRERFGARGDVLGKISGKASERHKVMNESYVSFLDEYLVIIDNLPADNLTPLNIENLKSIFRQFLPERKRPIIGSLPYRNLRLAARAPQMGPVITPGYQGGNTTVSEGDLASAIGAPITLEIAQLAESLHWNPVEIYAWVKNNIKTEWYWGMMKGTEETLRQKSGNDADQAALLVALYRAAGYPARFVRGVIEFFPDLTAIKKQTGITDTQQLLGFFQKAGIPCQPVISGGQLANIQTEHIWVEAQIPYANYRGAILDAYGKTWLGLDTHLKTSEVTESGPPRSIQSRKDLTGFCDEYLLAVQTKTPLELIRSGIETNSYKLYNTVYDSWLFLRSQAPEELNILPASLQFKQVAVTGEFTAIHSTLRHQVRFIATGGNRQLFDETIPLMALSNRSVAVTYEPSTIEDQEIINSYGGLNNTPAYLVNLRPVLTVDGERSVVGSSGLPVGGDFTLTVELIGPQHREQVENRLIIGNLAVLGFVAQKVVMPESGSNAGAEYLLHERALDYIDRWNSAEDELASLFHLTMVRPLPTLVTVGGVVDVAYLLDTPHGFDWKGLYLDADLRTVETFGTAETSRLFLELSSLQGSVLESRVFEDGFGVESISTAELFGLANSGGVTLVTLDQSNLATELPGLDLPENIAADIENSVHQGMKVTIPATEMVHEDWLGTGYLKENPVTGEAGWMLSGMIAGGMTVLNPDRWPGYYVSYFSNAFSKTPNPDSNSAIAIKIVTATDKQEGVVGQFLPMPLMVLALDKTGAPVQDVPITFEVKAGGGSLQVVDPTTAVSAAPQLTTVKTNYNGIAKINISLGTHISENPTNWYTTPNTQLVGENIIEAYTESGLQASHHLSAFAFPDVPDHIEVTGGGNTGPILTWADTVIAKVVDRYGNPISNEEVSFTINDPAERTTCPNPNVDSQKGALVKISNSCLNNNIPAYGDCLPVTQSITETTSEIGAAVQVILGGVPDADYTITIKSDAIKKHLDPNDPDSTLITDPDKVETVTVTSLPFGNCDGYSPPQHDLVLKDINLTDGLGNIINAGPVGGTIPLQARMYFVKELGGEIREPVTCPDNTTDDCPLFVGNRNYTVSTEFKTATVSMQANDSQTKVSATGQAGGIFAVDDYPLGNAPGKKLITVTGNASTMVRGTANECDPQAVCALADAELAVDPISITKEIYAVDVKPAKAEYIVPVTAEGYVTADTLIEYDILPAEYLAGDAVVRISKRPSDPAAAPVHLRYLTSERQGHGFVTLARGFRSDFNAEYFATVILNNGSNATKIISREINLKPIALDLDADLNKDGLFTEDDPQETMGMGLVVPVNNDDDDEDGVIDRDDDLSLNQNENVAVADNDLIEVKLVALPVELVQGSVSIAVEGNTQGIRLWLDKEKGAGQLLLDPATESQKIWLLGADPANPNITTSLADLPTSLYIEGVNPSSAKGDIQLVIRYATPTGSEHELDRLVLTVVQADLVPDYNRDGVIDYQDRGRVTKTEPWRFWINDDDDMDSDPLTGLTTDPVVGGNPDDLPGQDEDNSDEIINGIRDMVDFFPLYLDIHKMLQFWKPVDGFEYRLSNADDAIGLFIPIYQGSFLPLDNVAAYLEDPEAAQSLEKSQHWNTTPIEMVTKEGLSLSGFLLSSIAESDQNGVVLLEARKATSNPLVLEVVKEGAVVYKVEFSLEIVPVEQMFGHKNLRWVAGAAADDPPDRFVDFTDQASPEYFANAKQPYCMQGADKNLVWMHGYNVGPEAARATYAEVFKRFFHAGLNGRFYAVTWFGNPPALGTKHYHQAAVNAFATAKSYADFMNSIPGSSSLAAHSFGNLVAGSAIQDHGLTDFTKYFAIDASIALEAYGQVSDVSSLVNLDGTLSSDPNAGMVNVVGWPSYIAAGQVRLLASEWYKLFEGTDDNRKELTWRDRLIGVVSDKVYNFYSSTEEVLRRYDDDNIFFDGYGLSVEALYISTWVKQEKFKGRMTASNPFDNIGGVSSPYGGWSFNHYWWVEDPSTISDGKEWMKMPPEEAAGITADKLRKDPFFDLRIAELVSDDPNDTAPSDFVMKWVSDTGLTDYYKDNEVAHKLVTVKDWLLAEAIPATTLPMGANENGIIKKEQNIDMSGVATPDGGCCKTSEGLWPREERYLDQRVWKHSDYKDVPYQHAYGFYKKITKLSAQ